MVSAMFTSLALCTMLLLTITRADSMDQEVMGGELPLIQKRPFCNAFTGCGRKRSGLRSADSSGELFPGSSLKRETQNKIWALLQQRMAEIEALRGLLKGSRK